jgi:hypothetical protein
MVHATPPAAEQPVERKRPVVAVPVTKNSACHDRATIRRRVEEAAGVEEATQSTETPLEFLLRKMHDTTAAPANRFQAAKAAAPFCHPQLQAVAHWFRDRHSHNWALTLDRLLLRPAAWRGPLANTIAILRYFPVRPLDHRDLALSGVRGHDAACEDGR